MCNIVTERFIKCHDALKASGTIKSSRQFAISVDYLPQSLNEILKGNRDVTIDLLRKAIEIYHLNAQYLFTGMGTMFSDQTNDSENINQEDENIENNILYVPVAAQAGYTDQFNDIIYKEDLIAFSLPDRKFKQGTYRCFDVAGDSMEPSLQSGDKVVCSLVERNLEYNGVRSNLVYVIVTIDDILVKRVQNNMRINSTFELLSDNTYYPPISLHVSEIKEIWHVDLLISNFMPSQKNNRKIFYDEISEMRKTISLQSSAIQNLNQTLEKLLKSNRSHSVV